MRENQKLNLRENWSIEITESSRETRPAKHMIVNIETIENEKLKDSRLKEAMRSEGLDGSLGTYACWRIIFVENSGKISFKVMFHFPSRFKRRPTVGIDTFFIFTFPFFLEYSCYHRWKSFNLLFYFPSCSDMYPLFQRTLKSSISHH